MKLTKSVAARGDRSQVSGVLMPTFGGEGWAWNEGIMKPDGGISWQRLGDMIASTLPCGVIADASSALFASDLTRKSTDISVS
jgi:hypothetical protein